mmetsp:Transcript_33343/g.56965  ORF Transcript_33343/g.56965 Transcript_33343/m.56965 type:complete len:287 (-) Transcript_33343:659-1519(-)
MDASLLALASAPGVPGFLRFRALVRSRPAPSFLSSCRITLNSARLIWMSFTSAEETPRALESLTAISRVSSWSSPIIFEISFIESVPEPSVSSSMKTFSRFSSLNESWSAMQPPTNSCQSMEPSPSRSSDLRSIEVSAVESGPHASFIALCSSSSESVPVPSVSSPSNMLRMRCSSSVVRCMAIWCRTARWKRFCLAYCVRFFATSESNGRSLSSARFLIHGCCWMSLELRRLFGSLLSSLRTKSFASGETLSHGPPAKLGSRVRILASLSGSFLPEKACLPESIK